MKYIIAIAFIVLSFLYSDKGFAATIHVPGDHSSIQAGIEAAVDGDLVLVAQGTYVENIDFIRKEITLQSESGADFTVIDGNLAGTVVRINSEGVIDGFTICNGVASSGGGIFCADEGSKTIKNCVITENSATVGGAGFGGGGIVCQHAPVWIVNCIISKNTAVNGGGIYIYSTVAPDPRPIFLFCTITENEAVSGGGIDSLWGIPTFMNCILWGNLSASYGQEIYGTAIAYHSDIKGGWPGIGIIDEDPHFAGGGDYHLMSESPCIDSGIDAGIYTDLDGNERPLHAGYDMGAYEYAGPCWDGDRDGYGDEICGGDDCDDTVHSINPDADEVCDDEIDNDCDGFIDLYDLDCPNCIDMDGDGYGDPASLECVFPGWDCDDVNPHVNPGHKEVPGNGKDDDCDGAIDEPCFIWLVM